MQDEFAIGCNYDNDDISNHCVSESDNGYKGLVVKTNSIPCLGYNEPCRFGEDGNTRPICFRCLDDSTVGILDPVRKTATKKKVSKYSNLWVSE